MSDKDSDGSSDGGGGANQKRKRAEADKDDDEAPRVLDHSIADFRLAPVVAHFTCALCSGIYKEPVTITHCLHSFCKSCLYSAFSEGERQCPTCRTFLEGADPLRFALPDRTLESLCDKVLFPTVKEQDEIQEEKFYANRGIKLKPQAEATQTRTSKPLAAPAMEAKDELELLFFPDTTADEKHKLPHLKRSCLKVSGRLKIVQLKKFLIAKLDMSPALASSIEILCNDRIVGNELNLHFIERTRCLTSDPLQLFYKLSEDFLL